MTGTSDFQPMDGEQQEKLPLHPSTATRLRHQITPYLPPPIVAAINHLDPRLEPLVGPEASITLSGTLFISLVLWKIISLIFGQPSTTSGAIQDEQEDDAIVDYDDVSYEGTILFCGPSLAGKTSLFYSLVYPSMPSYRTVSSIKPNTGFVTTKDCVWRYLDTPGHWSPSKLTSTVFTPSTTVDRIVLVLDSTQPVTKAVDFLYALLGTQKGNILVACHKAKESKAKNVRRLKLQMRTELERISKLHSSTDIVDWDDVLSKRVALISTSVYPALLEELQAYLETGTFPPST